MTWVAMFLYLVPVAVYLKYFDDFCDEARASMMHRKGASEGLVIFIASASIVFWPIGMAIDLILGDE